MSGFIVFKNDEDDQVVGPSDYTGKTTTKEMPVQWRARYDHDGEGGLGPIACRGRCTEGSLNEFEPLACWAMPALGAVTLEYVDTYGDWRVL